MSGCAVFARRPSFTTRTGRAASAAHSTEAAARKGVGITAVAFVTTGRPGSRGVPAITAGTADSAAEGRSGVAPVAAVTAIADRTAVTTTPTATAVGRSIHQVGGKPVTASATVAAGNDCGTR